MRGSGGENKVRIDLMRESFIETLGVQVDIGLSFREL